MIDEGCYVIDETGRLFVTKYGREQLGLQFELAGIDMDSLKTEEEYFEARKKTFPYFMEALERQAPPLTESSSDACKLLHTIAFGTVEEGEAALHRFRVKSSLNVVK
jgi:hypothetical protein